MGRVVKKSLEWDGEAERKKSMRKRRDFDLRSNLNSNVRVHNPPLLLQHTPQLFYQYEDWIFPRNQKVNTMTGE